MRRIALGLVLVVATILVPSASALAVGTIDQQQPTVVDPTGGSTIGGDPLPQAVLAQVFTAGVTQNLSDVDLPIRCQGTPTVTIAVRDTAAYNGRWVPGATVLASASFAATAFPSLDATGFRTFSLTTPLAITAGTHYAIVVSAQNTTYPNACWWPFGPGGDSYSGGDAWFVSAEQSSSQTPGGWLCACDAGATYPHDFPFRTRVAPPSPILSLAIADSSDPMSAGVTYHYTVTLTNTGGAATDTNVHATLSWNLALDAAPGCLVTPPSQVSCDLGPLASGASATQDIFAHAVTGTSASVAAYALSAPASVTSPAATEYTTIQPVVDMQLTSLVTQAVSNGSPGPYGLDDLYVYGATATNNATNTGYDAHNAGVILPLPANTTYVGIFASKGFCGFDTTLNAYACNFGALAPGASAFLSLEVRAPSFPGTISATATARADELDPDTTNNAKTIQTQICCAQIQSTATAGGTVTTDPSGVGASALDPIQTSVTTPNAGAVSIREVPSTSQNTTSGYNLLGYEVFITAPSATSANPLVLVFELVGPLPNGGTASSLTIMRNGVAVPKCWGSTTAPAIGGACEASATLLANGNVRITVLTTDASRWSFAIHLPFTFTGFFAPLSSDTKATAGNAIPIKFSLAGDQGMNVVATAESRPCAGGKGEMIGMSGASALRYDAADDQYVMSWKTLREWAGSCRELRVTLADGSLHTMRVTFR